MKIAVIGATGVLGRHLIPRLVERGHDVRGSARNADGEGLLAGLGATPMRADILDRASLDPLVAGCDAALHVATAIPTARGTGDWAVNDRIRREGTAQLLDACAQAGVTRYLQQSVTMILTAADDRPQTEDDETVGAGRLASSVDAETQVRASDLDWRILRGGSFYGPGTGHGAEWLEAARKPGYAMPGDGSGFVSLIHIADMAEAVAAAIETGQGRTVWNAVDDEPVRMRDLTAYVAHLAGGPAPATGGPGQLASFRVSNARLKAELGWRPRYASYRSGLAG
ncbi:MAG TPA: NAD(P)-dependent oxidoreductase [Alphaproteobacteria bacterium]|nr:NAD(P)-dependent oxidoreductase [Alphaproteobacteria bacterium]